MKRCKHSSIRLEEEYTTTGCHFITDGTVRERILDEGKGEYTGRFFIYCYECGKTFYFPSYRTAPKWAQRYYDVATAG